MMRHIRGRRVLYPIIVLICSIILSSCAASGDGRSGGTTPATNEQSDAPSDDRLAHEEVPVIEEDPREPETSSDAGTEDQGDDSAGGVDPAEPASNGEEEQTDYDAIRASYDITDPDSIAVLVNKTYGLPEDYEPDDLVKVDIPFVYQDETVHSMRKIAADALILLFEGAKKDGLELAGVSGYRSYAIQKMLYEKYVARDGEEAANKYSARPGHSEHSTGLAMDVAGISGKCAANNCFAGTPEALWLADHAHEYGFIIRYPLGKEDITGYQYEPWHLRYVGTELAAILHENDWTMEEFFLGAESSDAGAQGAE